MTNPSAESVGEYISAAPKEARSHLKELQAVVKSAVPNAEEGIRWGKPYYKLNGMLAGFDAYANHIGFEIWADALAEEDRKKLEESGYKTTQRTFHIRYDQDVPKSVIKKMLKAQATANESKRNKK